MVLDSKALDINCAYLGISRLLLMENAGKEIANAAREYNKIAVFCGMGNNGGDGFAAARHLSGLEGKVKVYALDCGVRSHECQTNLDIVKNLSSIELRLVRDSSECDDIAKELEDDEFDLIIDALVGVGVEGSLREPVKSLAGIINENSRAFKISVDIPSGMEVKADLTVSFHYPKTPDAKVVDIGIPKEAELYCGPGDVYTALPERKEESHKGDYGRVLIVGGSRHYLGAPSLVAEASLRVGADLTVICTPSYVADHACFSPNLIVRPLESKDFLSGRDVEFILEQNFDALVLGNGLGVEEETKDAARALIECVGDKPLILDADALKLIKPKHVKENMILTPHSGEFKTLFGEYDETERVRLVEKNAKETNSVIVLKGAVDVVSDGEVTRLNDSGNPGMTVGGTGDVLAGIIGGLAAQGAAQKKGEDSELKKLNFKAACAGVFLCGLAGDVAYDRLGFSLLATDVIDSIPEALKYCRKFF